MEKRRPLGTMRTHRLHRKRKQAPACRILMIFGERQLEKVLPDVEEQYRVFLQNEYSGRMRGDDLWLTPHNEFVHNMVKRDPAVLETIKKKASVVAGRPVRVRLGEEAVGSLGSDDKFAQLIGDMGKYDNMKVQQ